MSPTPSRYARSEQDESKPISSKAQEDYLSREQSIPSGLCPCFSLAYWQRYFTIEQSDLSRRVLASLDPRKTQEFIEGVERQPDLYGPFWICSSVVFLSIICSSLSFIADRVFFGAAKQGHEYNHANLGFLFSTVYGFLLAVPAALTFGLKFADTQTSLVKVRAGHQNICFYGYSFASFALVACVLWYPSLALRIFFIALASLYSFVRLAFVYMAYALITQQSRYGAAALQGGDTARPAHRSSESRHLLRRVLHLDLPETEHGRSRSEVAHIFT